MKKLTYLILLFCTPLTIKAQNTKLDFNLAKLSVSKAKVNEYVNVLIKGNVDKVKQELASKGAIFKSNAGDIISAKIPVVAINEIAKSQFISRIETANHRVELMNDTMVKNTNIDKVHAGTAPLSQAYTGKGVIMGIIDSGFDSKHPDFQYSNGKTRAKYFWDQNQPFSATNTPSPYGYGQAWDSLEIDANEDTVHNPNSYNAHGTHVLGVAAGNGNAVGKFQGASIDCDIIAVAMDFNNSDGVVDGVDYIFSKADELGKPCVINLSLGDYWGSHDGKNLEAQFIDNLIKQKNGRSVVAAVGNMGDNPFHLGYTVTSDTNFTWMGGQSNSGYLYFQVWADSADFENVQFSLGADRVTPVYERITRTNFYSNFPSLGVLTYDTLWNDTNRIATVLMYGQMIDGVYGLEVQIVPDSTQYFYRFQTTGSGKFDMWNLNFYGNTATADATDMVEDNLPTVGTFPEMAYYKLPDRNQNMVSSFQCLESVITVGSYINRKTHLDYDGNITTIDQYPGFGVGDIASESSAGPTRDGRTKPDIIAPGSYTLAAVPADLSAALVAASQGFALASGGYHLAVGATSNASPVIAGVAALYLEKNPNAGWLEVKNAITNCAMVDAYTGSVPNNKWGYGKVDAFNTMVNCSVGIDNKNESPKEVLVYPNPAVSKVAISLPNIAAGNNRIKVYNELGKLVIEKKIIGNIIELDVQNLSPAVYFYQILNNNNVTSSGKFAKM